MAGLRTVRTVRRAVVVWAWLAFLSSGVFWAVSTPLGEGFDESWHLAYVQHASELGSVPLGHSEFISAEIDLFLHSHPVPWGLHRTLPNSQSYDVYWKNERSDRQLLEQRIRSLRFSGEYTAATGNYQYENHQPPLYYFICAPVFAIASRMLPLVDVFLIVRLFSVLIASFVVPGGFLLFESVFEGRALAQSSGALLVLFPGLYLDIARVSNDALAVPLMAWTLYLLVLTLRNKSTRSFWVLAALLIAGLWTKAFFIPILAGILLVFCIEKKWRFALLLLLPSALGSPWYLYNLFNLGSFTGLPETVKTSTSILSSIQALWTLDWTTLFNVLASSHIWIANWSQIGVRSWMYRVIVWSFLLVTLGLVRQRQSWRGLMPVFVPYAVFLAGLVYVATQVLQHKGVSVAEGWYLACLVPVEVILFVQGARGWLGEGWRWPVATLQLFLLALFVYGAVFVAMPYYAGLIYHVPSGHLLAFKPGVADWALMSSRLLRFHPWLPSVMPWALLSFSSAFGFHAVKSTLSAS